MASYHHPMFRPQSDDDGNNGPNVRLYSPYQDLQIPYQTLYRLPTEPELLFPEQSLQKGRSWADRLCQYPGYGFLAGSLAGASKGFVDGLRASEYGDTMKLKISRILNASGQSGRNFGNRAGVIGLFYFGMESAIFGYRAEDDVINSVAAGMATGVLYRVASGPRSAAVAGVIGGMVAGLAVAAKRYSSINQSKLLL